ncbi:MAG: GNAT family N-acetyltransferase [Cellulosilyticaceae bacterium]
MVMIREAIKSDLAGLSILFEELIRTKSSIEKMTKIFRYIQNDESYKLIVAEQDGEIVGTIMGVLCYDLVGECRPFMVIENVVVANHKRGQGLGSKLIREIEDIGKKNEVNYMMFVSEAERIEAHKFYESVGYELDVVQGFKKFL